MSIYSIFRSTGISLSNRKGYGMIWYDHLAVAALNMRDFCWIRSFALTEATQRKQKLCLRANKRERREASQPSRRPEARRGSGAVVEAVASPDRLQYNKQRPTIFLPQQQRVRSARPTLLIQKANWVGLATSRRYALTHLTHSRTGGCSP